MTDKELLELAAKAAGDVTHEEVWKGEYSHFERNGHGWNPLTDDGDSLRLAVKLGMSVSVFTESIDPRTEVCSRVDGSLFVDESPRHNSDDPYAATRRAIVRAAAEIGKEMK